MDRRELLAGIGAVAVAAVIPASAAEAVSCEVSKTFIVPDIMRCEHARKIVRENTITTIYEFMERWTIGSDGRIVSLELARVDSDRYCEWIKDMGPNEVLPHIGFGGCVVPDPKGDPLFHSRWVEFARTLRA